MRVTSTTVKNNAIKAMQHNLKQLADSQLRASTGKKYTSFAENPQSQSEVMRNAGALRALEQYGRNVNDALSRSSFEDTVLDQLGTTLTRARQIAIEQGSSTASELTRGGAIEEVNNLIEFVVGLGNTKYADSYLFGGDNSDVPPLSGSAPYYTTSQPPNGNHLAEISAGRMFKVTHNAGEVFFDSGVISSLTSLASALGSGDQTVIGASIAGLISAHQGVQSLVGDLGAKINQLDTVSSSLESMRLNLTAFDAELTGIGAEEAFTELMSRETTLQAAMLATSRVMGMTLTDYLR